MDLRIFTAMHQNVFQAQHNLERCFNKIFAHNYKGSKYGEKSLNISQKFLINLVGFMRVLETHQSVKPSYGALRLFPHHKNFTLSLPAKINFSIFYFGVRNG